MRIIPKRTGLTLPTQHEARLRAVVIVATLLLSVLIGLRPGSRLAMLPGLAVFGLLGLAALLRYLPWGVIALIPIAFLVDVRIGTGTNVAFNATFLFVLGLIGVWRCVCWWSSGRCAWSRRRSICRRCCLSPLGR